MGHVLHQSTASSNGVHWTKESSNIRTAEFRGPGVRHQYDHDSLEEYDDLDLDHRSRNYGRSGRIILLGDGTEVLTDSDDVDMFDHTEEDRDAENQVQKGPSTTHQDSTRSEREGTPAPQTSADDMKATATTSPSSTHTEASQGPDMTTEGVSGNTDSKKDA
jgi:protein phosphatase PTC2/3